jgi:hypothetical protein
VTRLGTLCKSWCARKQHHTGACWSRRQVWRRRLDDVLAWVIVGLVLAGIVAAIGGGMALHAHLVYDDWTCGFSRCVKLRP